MLFFVGQVLPYIAGAVFLVGVACRIASWCKAPVPFQLTLFPAPRSGAGRIAAMGGELLLFRSLYKSDRSLWLWVWLFHVSLAVVIGGHVVGIYFLMNQFTLIGLSAAASQALSAALGTAFGLLLLAALLALFYRRLADPEVKRLSDPADFIDLLLLLAVAVTGNHMRLLAVHTDLPAIKAYMGGLLTLSPTPIPENGIFIAHFLLVNLLLIYFPFSKMLHFAGFLINRTMLTEAPPVYPTPAGTALRSPFAGGRPAKASVEQSGEGVQG
ncbi:MAG TPA: respiratory nitrate reductase subunit gamma [Selenomonadales bacterium]|nr:respiratory nitrate reductase subunit gamma [Selenomonadales bacterium]